MTDNEINEENPDSGGNAPGNRDLPSRAKGLANKSKEAIDSFVLGRLQILRDAMKKMVLSPTFITALEKSFVDVLGNKLGSVPVFLRSDTNMEDLKDFTGAGLNLTVFNVVERDKIMQGIRDVWASPYSERSYKWRQRFLQNPENVYPSILIIPSIDVDVSGVLITKSLITGEDNGVTIAFNRGVAGAVEGQFSETWILGTASGDYLVKPSRETLFTTLPTTGGTQKRYTTFDKPVLNNEDLILLDNLAGEIKERLPHSMGMESVGPFDVELGLKDGRIWLFQVRPFVENKKAASSEYLLSINPALDAGKKLPLNIKIKE